MRHALFHKVRFRPRRCFKSRISVAYKEEAFDESAARNVGAAMSVVCLTLLLVFVPEIVQWIPNLIFCKD